MLIDTLTEDMKAAMKARDTARLGVLRMTLSEIKNARIEKGSDLTEDDVIQVIRRAVKKREEAAEAFRNGNRPELAENEAREAEVLTAYLPRMIAGPELEEIVVAAIAETGAAGPKDMGKVMKAVMAAHGTRVDGKGVQAIVRAKLGAG
jgi:uncharacterized protein YqeY